MHHNRSTVKKRRPAVRGPSKESPDNRYIGGRLRQPASVAALVGSEPDAVPRQTGHAAEGRGFSMVRPRIVLVLKPDALPCIGGETAGRTASHIIRLGCIVILKPDALIGAVCRSGNGQQQDQRR
jgi:hypothetical protein